MKFGVRVVIISTLLTPLAWAAPDEDVLGKSQGYPNCPLISTPVQQRCLVGMYSGYDQILPARQIAKGAAVTELKRAEREVGADAFMAANRNTGLLVMKDGAVLAERYNYDRKPEHRFASMSMAKTLVAMMIGIALEEKKIGSLDDTADQYVPALKGHPYGETKLRHLLTMSSGIKFSEAYDGKDDMSVLVDKTFFHKGPGGADSVSSFRARENPPGTKWSYASAETQVLGLVLRAATGKPLAEYLSEKIWQPMGAEADASWNIDAGGQEIAYCCINATLRDFARVGLMLANDGAINGRQVVPAAWVKEATTAQAPHLQVGRATQYNGYGYQTWLIGHPRGGGDKSRRFALLGVRGQAVFVDPDRKLVVVHTAVHASARDFAARSRQFEYLNNVIARLEQ